MQVKRSYRLASPRGGRDPEAAAHFERSHPLASVALQRCTHLTAPRQGRVACGPCWERAIRDDERFAVECDLPREVSVDPLLVDEIAVERACAGERVSLTRVEFRAAVRRLLERGLDSGQIARRMRRDGNLVRRVLAALSREVAA